MWYDTERFTLIHSQPLPKACRENRAYDLMSFSFKDVKENISCKHPLESTVELQAMFIGM
jgi:hypothetical protein